MLLVKDRQILGKCVGFFSLLHEVLSATGPQMGKRYPSDTKLRIGYRNRNYDKLTGQMEGKGR